ncbi:MalM family protein, partial [Salinicola rhizosphaerae]|uniref:MalM family protein n=1 Tax=Salinicola rhizosphaerae TaxID=1443141 RepID=UPI00167C065E
MSNSYRLILPLGALMLALAGCSTPLMTPPPQSVSAQAGEQALATAPDCCTSLASLPYRPLDVQERITLNATPQSPAHDFGDGKSFFHAFELPQSRGPLSLSVTSPIRDGQLFAPTILILDASYRPVREMPSEALTLRRPSGFSGARLTGEFSLTPGPAASYLIVYSSAADRASTTRYESEEKAYARVRGLAEPATADPLATHTATGDIILEVAPLMGEAPMLVSDQSPRPAPMQRTAEVAEPPASVRGRESPETSEPLDYRRMIQAALKAGDIELALQLADRAEREGQAGTRAWLA